jgi:hypothetical protein
MRWSPFVLVFAAGGLFGHAQGCTSPAEDGCAPGSEGCPCTSGGECDGTLMCLSDLCVDANGSSGGGVTDASAGSMSMTSAGTTASTTMGTTAGTTETTTLVTSISSDTGGTDETATDGGTTTGGMVTAESSDGGTTPGGTVEFHGNFLHNVDADGECEEWNDFRAELVSHTYTKITMSGSEDPVGRSCEGPAADSICQAIFTGSATTVGCDDGIAWSITDDCFGGLELDASNIECSCGYYFSVRPCSQTNYWGGLGTDTCDTSSQSIDVVCEY